jgi:thiol-disulfide isomerase/thioredoxin
LYKQHRFMSKAFIKHYILIVFLLLTVIYPSGVFAHKVNIQRPEPYYAPDVNFFDENGDKIFLDQFEGKTVLLVFWASWCGACVSEMPSLDVLQKDFRKLPLEIIALSEDYLGVEAVKKYFASQEIRHLKI